MKKFFAFLFVFIFFFSLTFVSSVPPVQTNTNPDNGLQVFHPAVEYVKQNSEFKLHLHVSNLSNGFPLYNTDIECHIHLYNSTGQHTYTNGLEKDSNGWDHEVTITSGNFSDIGQHAFYIWCNNSYLGGEVKGVFNVNPSGEKPTIPKLNAIFYLLLFFVGVALLLFWAKRNINFDQWYSKLCKQYQERNMVKFVFSSMGYHIMKQTFVLYYLIIFFIIMMVYDITFLFNIESILQVMKIIISFYAWGFILIGIVFFSMVQEWFVDLIKDLEDMKWGTE